MKVVTLGSSLRSYLATLEGRHVTLKWLRRTCGHGQACPELFWCEESAVEILPGGPTGGLSGDLSSFPTIAARAAELAEKKYHSLHLQFQARGDRVMRKLGFVSHRTWGGGRLTEWRKMIYSFASCSVL